MSSNNNQYNMENNEKKALLEEAAKQKGIPQKLIARYTITPHFNLDHALTELSNEWADLRELALTGEITDKSTSKQEADKASARSAMQSEAEKLLGIESGAPSAQSETDLQYYANKLVNE
jgi:hypothetical protein